MPLARAWARPRSRSARPSRLSVESVVWITERRDVQSTFFFLLSTLGYLRAADEGPDGQLSPGWRRLSVLAFVGAVMSKSSTIMLPAALLLLDVYPLRRLRVGWRRLIVEKLPYFLVAAADVAVAWIAVRAAAPVTSLGTHGLGGRIAMVLYSFFFYPWKLVWPVELSPMYEVPARVDPLALRFLVPAVLVVMVTAILVALRRRWPAGLAAWIYSALMILPLSGVVHIGHQLVQERWSYLSGMGFVLLAGGGVARLLDARAHGRVSAMMARTVLVGGGALVVVLGAAAWDQCKVWQDSETLWGWAASLDPQCQMCWNNLGGALIGQQRHAEAETAYRRALQLGPTRAALANNVASALLPQGKVAEAEELLREAIRLDPNLTGALFNLGSHLAQTQRTTEALRYLRKAHALEPSFPGLARELAAALVAEAARERQARRPGEAAALYREALEVLPGNPQANEGLETLAAAGSGGQVGRTRP